MGKDTAEAETICPNCKDSFTCRNDDIASCQCYGVSLSEQTREFLNRTSPGCLCRSCLEKTEAEITTTKTPSVKSEKPALVENLHYYIEGKYYVFTELYHKQRGYCCKNNCRHCPYQVESELVD